MTDIEQIRAIAQKQLDEVIPSRADLNQYGIRTKYYERLDYELETIEELGFARIFLMVHKIMAFARSEGIRVGPGRGSAAASLVCWLLGITALDPIRYQLDFHRFLIKGRVSLPDIDIDIERTGRARIVEYLKSLVGADHIAKIGTFSVMHEKGALRDVARILEMEEPERYRGMNAELNEVAKQIPNRLGGERRKASNLKQLVQENHALRQFYRRYPKLFHLADKLVGLPRHTSVHPAGVLVVNRPVVELVPLQRDEPITATPITQWEMKDTDKQMLFKLDLLALDSLDLISECCHLANVEVIGLEPTDARVFRAFARGECEGIFQFDKDYVKSVFKKVQVDCFDDLVAINALIRPGAKTTNSLEDYAARKHGETVESSLPPTAGACVADTHGLILFQEQAMRIARECASFSITEADDLRKGIAKDYDTSMMRDKFLAGCVKTQIPQRDAYRLWRVLENAGKYMFNRAHSTCYSYIAYQMMWLKVYYPKQFWTAMLNSNLGDDTKFRFQLKHVRRSLKYQVEKVGALRSRATCWYDSDQDAIVLGFLTVKGIGHKAAEELERIRDSTNMVEWIHRVNRRQVNSKTMEVLLKSGAFEVFGRSEEELHQLFARSKATSGNSKRGEKISEMYLVEEFAEKPVRETMKQALEKYQVE
jgi:DNA polymerase-3 subunit alpha